MINTGSDYGHRRRLEQERVEAAGQPNVAFSSSRGTRSSATRVVLRLPDIWRATTGIRTHDPGFGASQPGDARAPSRSASAKA